MNYWNEREELRALRERYGTDHEHLDAYERDVQQWRSEYAALHAEWEAVAHHSHRLREVLTEVVQAYRAGDLGRLGKAVERAEDLLGLEEVDR